jgi:hypothetical protein
MNGMRFSDFLRTHQALLRLQSLYPSTPLKTKTHDKKRQFPSKMRHFIQGRTAQKVVVFKPIGKQLINLLETLNLVFCVPDRPNGTGLEYSLQQIAKRSQALG